MGFNTENIDVFKIIISQFLSRFLKPLDSFEQVEFDDYNYIPGGYVECKLTRKREKIEGEETKYIKLDKKQLSYLEKIISFSSANGSKLILVVQPIPKEVIKRKKNYSLYSQDLKKIAVSKNIDYWDFNTLMELDEYGDFADEHHLNQKGVEKFNSLLIGFLKEKYPEKK